MKFDVFQRFYAGGQAEAMAKTDPRLKAYVASGSNDYACRHDVSNARPSPVCHLISGTKAFAQKYALPRETVIDAEGMYVSPGFIDIHVHGGGGYDIMDNTVEAFQGVAATHAQYGTTAMLPTTLTKRNC
ncbi:hypothetical protein FQR65_LT17650 [Abscondita terminalis]|nr:hypothetical protein FQR65_LT17650 [Abscondita terminalis]